MRIIAGIHRGRRLLPPENDATRPITDRVKQSLFDVLAPRIEGARVLDIFAGTGSMGLESLSRGAGSVTFFESDRSAVRLLRQNIETLGVADRSTIISLDLFKWFAGRGSTREGACAAAVDHARASPFASPGTPGEGQGGGLRGNTRPGSIDYSKPIQPPPRPSPGVPGDGEGSEPTVQPSSSRTLANLVFLDPPYRFLMERADDLRRLALQLASDHLAPDAVVVFRHDSANELDLSPLRRTDQRTYGSMTIELLAPS